MAYYQFNRLQKISATKDEIWKFISDPQNLSEITPPELKFSVISKILPRKIYNGLLISYKVSPLLGIEMDWVSEIKHVKEGSYFVDEQKIGPYAFWYHQHEIIEINNGVIMKDVVSYKIPFGILGRIAHKLFIRKQLKRIFDYRQKKLDELFGIYDDEKPNVYRLYA